MTRFLNETEAFFFKTDLYPDLLRQKVDTQYKDVHLAWNHEHTDNGSVYFAYFPPFSYARHLDLVEQCSKFSRVELLGQTLDGREMECIVAGTGKLKWCWIIHRQHPGEHMAKFFAKGLLTRLLGLDAKNGDVDGIIRRLLSQYMFYIVPSMCPASGIQGHLRTNTRGANLN
jgi:murein tripeptide amidase MpaA